MSEITNSSRLRLDRLRTLLADLSDFFKEEYGQSIRATIEVEDSSVVIADAFFNDPLYLGLGNYTPKSLYFHHSDSVITIVNRVSQRTK